MIEKEILAMKRRSFLIEQYLTAQLPKGSYSFIELKKTPLGEKIIVHTSRPGLIVGKKGSNIQSLTSVLKTKFKMENPQIDVAEVESPNLDPKGIGERIVSTFEKYGPKRFKSIGYRALQDIIDAGAIGAEIVISGRGVPGSRSKRWRFMAGHLKKSGNVAQSFTDKALTVAHLQSGAIGIQVKIIHPDVILPDTIRFKLTKEDLKPQVIIEEIKEEKIEEDTKKEKEVKKRKSLKVNEIKTGETATS
ncbi:30S ribosomal protein S3 [Candidatus Woesearchaeota archaeon]|uniref:30S ribosomal protein S3 n=1 Tax=uncultured organism TaxID=155900 RepID=U3GW00_9ZZZZ|nr:30S ribosomal protein S3 [uncultured organism]AJS12571.1 30S ribosomal protein S3 [uncultured archaeon]MBS3140880.1 30S ribosomal protein S3 [Candidatus Woesearchaeota archaeon]